MALNETDRRIVDIRERVHLLLTAASSKKLIRHETRKALEKLREADELIEQYDLPEPWPSLCAYRMGHLMLRTASTDKELIEAKSKFAIARGSKCLGPLPDIYNLAVLYRLHKRDRQSIKAPFDSAEQAIKRLEVEKDPRLTDHTFNLLELATYFSGLSYKDLEGMGFPQKRLSISSPWMLVGPDTKWSRVVFSETEALTELDGLMRRREYRSAVFFKLSDKNAELPSPSKRHWKYKEKDWQKTAPQRLRLLSLSMLHPTCPVDTLIGIVEGKKGEGPLPNALSRLKTLLKKDLSTLTGINKNSVYDTSFSGFLRINPMLKIFGAVECSAIHLENDEQMETRSVIHTI